MNAPAKKTVSLRTSVRVRGLVPGEDTTICFVPESETKEFDHGLPLNSIVGEALVGAEVGDRPSLETFDDEIELEVLEVQPIEQ
jgi:transcription elongation GreA/GreB family factor